MSEQIINFYSENDFEFQEEKSFDTWIRKVISSEEKQLGEINYIFCDDHYLYKINLKFLDHDTYTDIISFDNSERDGASIKTEPQTNKAIVGIPSIGSLKMMLEHLKFNGEFLNWKSFAEPDWDGVEDYRDGKRFTIVVRPNSS